MGRGPCRGAAGHLHRRRARRGQVAAGGGDRRGGLRARALSCCSGSCSPEPGGPYQPFAECLEQLLGGTQPGALADCLPDTAAELLRLTPLVWRHRPELASPGGDGGDYRRELFDAVTGCCTPCGEQRPVVCVLEDLHWASQPTLQLLDHVAAAVGQSPGCCCCARTVRPRRTAATTSPTRSRTCTGWTAYGGWTWPGSASRRLPSTWWPSARSASAGRGSTPPYCATRPAVTRSSSASCGGTWRARIRSLAQPAAPTRAFGARAPVSVRDTLQRRLSRLAAGDRAAVETAAVLGDGGPWCSGSLTPGRRAADGRGDGPCRTGCRRALRAA